MAKVSIFANNFHFFKLSYQEGRENDCKLLCYDGRLSAGSVVLSYKSRYLEQMISKARQKQEYENREQPVELNFKSFPVKVVKVIFHKI